MQLLVTTTRLFNGYIKICIIYMGYTKLYEILRYLCHYPTF